MSSMDFSVIIDRSHPYRPRIKFLPSLGLSLLVPILFAFILSLTGLINDPIVFQLSAIVMAILFCLHGILRRSKLEAVFLNLPIAIIDYLIMYGLHIVTGGWFLHPYGIFGSLTGPNGPITDILNNPDVNQLSGGIVPQIKQYAPLTTILDLIFVIIIALFIGFFVTALVTGFRNKEGEFSSVAIPFKIIAAFFFLVLIIIVPFTYSGLSKFVEGSSYVGAAVADFAFLATGTSGGGAALSQQNQNPLIDLTDPQFQQQLIAALKKANIHLTKAYQAYRHVQQNFLLIMILNNMGVQQIQIDQNTAINVKNIPQLLSITKVLADIAEAGPSLIYGLTNLYGGLDSALKIIQSTGTFAEIADLALIETTRTYSQLNTSEYSNEFKTSLQKIILGVNNLTEAKTPILSATNEALQIANNVFIDLQQKPNTVKQMLETIKLGLPVLLDAAQAFPDFLNATYQVMLAMGDLAQNNFLGAGEWMRFANLDIFEANATIGQIDETNLPTIEEEGTLPFRATLEFTKDFINMLFYLTAGGVNMTGTLIGLNTTLSLLDDISFNSSQPSTDPTWAAISNSLSSTRLNLTDLRTNIETAANLTKVYQQKNYGALNDTVQPQWNQLDTVLSNMTGKVRDAEYLFNALEYTYNASYKFALGSEALNNSLITSTDNNTFATNPLTTQAEENYTQARNDAQQAYDLLQNAKFIDDTSKQTWLYILKDGGTNKSIYGLSTYALGIIESMKTDNAVYSIGNTLLAQMLDKMEAINFASIFKKNS